MGFDIFLWPNFIVSTVSVASGPVIVRESNRVASHQRTSTPIMTPPRP